MRKSISVLFVALLVLSFVRIVFPTQASAQTVCHGEQTNLEGICRLSGLTCDGTFDGDRDDDCGISTCCIPCGEEGQDCCPSPLEDCKDDVYCNPSTNTCTPCGETGEICCPHDPGDPDGGCKLDGVVCDPSTNTCPGGFGCADGCTGGTGDMCADGFRAPDKCYNVETGEPLAPADCCRLLGEEIDDDYYSCKPWYTCVPEDVPPEVPPLCSEINPYYDGYICVIANTSGMCYDNGGYGVDSCRDEDGYPGDCCYPPEDSIPRDECYYLGGRCIIPDRQNPPGSGLCPADAADAAPMPYSCSEDDYPEGTICCQLVALVSCEDSYDGTCREECLLTEDELGDEDDVVYTDCLADGRKCCVPAYTPPVIVPQEVFCKLGSDNPDDRTSNPISGKIATAIGCIPVRSNQEFVRFLLQWGSGIAGGIALVLIAVAGIMFITSAGDPKRMQAAKELLTAAISGLLLLIFGVFVLEFIGVDILGIPGFGS